MNLNSKIKPFCHLTIAELFPNDTGKQQKNDKITFGSDALDLWFLVYATTRRLIS